MSDGTRSDRLPDGVAELPDVPGAVSTRPDVLAAQSSVVAARERLEAEVDQLGRSARATFDLRERVRRLPEDAAEDPVRTAAVGAAGLGVVAGLVALVRRSRRPKPPGILPREVEDVVGKLGKDREKVREALDLSFRSYLKEHAHDEPAGQRRLRAIVGIVATPVAAAVAREVMKRLVPETEDEATGGTAARKDETGRAGGPGR